jgi:hypothetical protein
MKSTALIGTSILGLLLGTTALARAQHGHEGNHNGVAQRQHENNPQRDNGHPSAQHSKGHETAAPQRQPVHKQQARQTQAPGPEASRGAGSRQPRQRPVRDVWQPHRAQHWQREHRTWQQRGGYHGERIPEARFREHFGRGHWFRIHDVPVIVVNGDPRFQYQGYWFTLVDPWPESWSPTWYRSDDVCIDYVNDGYYLYNRRHPGIAIAVSVSF